MLNPVGLTVDLTLCLQTFEMCVALLQKNDTFYCTCLIVCSLIIMFQCDYPFLSFDTYIYIYIYSSDYIYHFLQKTKSPLPSYGALTM